MRIAIANFSRALDAALDYRAAWAAVEMPPPPPSRLTLFEQPFTWGFHLYAPGVLLMDRGEADRVEFWDYQPARTMHYLPNGVLKVTFHNARDVAAYVDRFGPPDLFVNHGVQGVPVVGLLEGRTFRVHVPTRRHPTNPLPPADCWLLDGEDQLVERSMLYIPVVNTTVFRPSAAAPQRDFVYVAWPGFGKRQDIVVNAVRGTGLTGHFHPVASGALDLSGTHITTSAEDERDVVELLQTSRIAVYPGDQTSNPAAMWECVAAGRPIVVNAAIEGGKHVVVPGVTGELAAEDDFLEVMQTVLARRDHYTPREHFEAHWDTVTLLDGYLDFFRRMGWNP